MAMEFQLTTGKAQKELQDIEQRLDGVARKFEETSRTADSSMERVSQAAGGSSKGLLYWSTAANEAGKATQAAGQAAEQATPKVGALTRMMGALSSVNLSGVISSVTGFAGALASVVVPPGIGAISNAFTAAAASIAAAGGGITGTLSVMAGGFGRLLGSINPVTIALGAFAAAIGLGIMKGISSDVQEAAAIFEKFRSTIVATTGSQQEAVAQWEFVRKTANATATDLEQVAKSYTRFSIAAQQSGLSLQTTQDIFSKLAATFRVFQLDAKSTGLAFLAFEQMINKGKVSMEELRRQLGEHLPGAMGAMAKALGVSVAELDRMVRSGQLGVDAVKKMVDQLYTDFGSKLPEALRSAQAQFQILSNTMLSLRAAFGTAFNSEMIPALQRFIAVLQSPAIEAFAAAWGRLAGAAFGTIISAFTVIANVIGVIATAIGPLVGLINSGLIAAFEGISYVLGGVNSALEYTQGLFGSFWSGVSTGLSYAYQFVKVIGSDAVSALGTLGGWLSQVAGFTGRVFDVSANLADIWDTLTRIAMALAGTELAFYFMQVWEAVKYVANSMLNFAKYLADVTGLAGYFAGVMERVRAAMEGAAPAARKAASDTDRLNQSMDDAAKKATGAANAIRDLVDAQGALAGAGWVGKNLSDFGIPGFEDLGVDPKRLKRMNELSKQFDADYAKHSQGSASPTATPGGSELKQPGESWATWYKRLFDTDLLSGKRSDGSDMNDRSMYDAHGQKVQQNTDAIKQAVQAFERSTGVQEETARATAEMSAQMGATVSALESNSNVLQASNDNISTLSGSFQAAENALIQSADAAYQQVEASNAAAQAASDMVQAVDPLTGMLDSTNAELDTLNTQTFPESIDAMGDLESATEYNTDANYFSGDAANSLAEATAALEGSMNELNSTVANADMSGGGGGGGGGEGQDGGGGGDTGMVETPEFSGGGISHKKRPTKRVPISAFSKAPRFADGGIPSILHPDEAVIPLSGGAVPVQMMGGGGGLSVGLLTSISETLRTLHQDFKDTQLIINNGDTLAHNDAVKTQMYLQMLQDLEVEQTKYISQLVTNFDVLSNKLLEVLGRIEALAEQTRNASSGGGGSVTRSGAGTGTGGDAVTNKYSKYVTQHKQIGGFQGGFSPTPAMYQMHYDDKLMKWVADMDQGGNPISQIDPHYWVGRTAFAEGSPNVYDEAMGRSANVTIHPDEAVVPLPDGRSIPMDFDEEGMVQRILDGMGNRRGGNNINITMHVHAKDASSFNASQNQILRDLQGKMQQAVHTLGPANIVDDPTRK